MPKEKAVSVSDRISPADFQTIADTVIEEWKSRKKRRGPLEKHWGEVDRQLRMQPEKSHKVDTRGSVIKGREWMPEVELPLQAQTLEMLMADVRRLVFPQNRDFFQARAALTESYLKRWEKAGSPFAGERAAKDAGIHAHIAQDNADRLAAAAITNWHAQYDFRAHIDQCAAQALSYGYGAGRLRKVKRRILGYDARPNGAADQKIPMLIPRDVRHVYLDDNVSSVMHEGYTLGPNIIQDRTVNYADYVAAAIAGGNDPKDEDGGYLLNEIKRLAPSKGKSETITLVEMEGDLVVDRSSSSIIIRDVVVTAAIGGDKTSGNAAFVRYREGEDFSTYIIIHYHREGPNFAYGASPLLKGMPVAKLAAQCMNRIVESSQIRGAPPIAWDKTDMNLAASGGPRIAPFALWEASDLSSIKEFTELGGDPAALWQVFVGLTSMYADMTGVNPPRLGAQTKSHTTAFAKDAELSQGAVRTVDFVNSMLEGPLTRLLHLEYRMGLSAMRDKQTIYVPSWNEFVSITRQHLPETVKFTAIGAGAPAEDQARNAGMLSSAQLALQLDQIGMQTVPGYQPSIDLPALIQQVLTRGGWTDTSEITTDGTGSTPQAEVGLNLSPGVVSQNPDVLEQL